MASPFQGTHHRQMPCLSVSMAGSNYWAGFPDLKCVRSTASVGPYKGTFKPMVFGQIQIAADTQMSALRAIAFSQYLESHGRRLYGAAIMAEVIAAKEILKHIRKGDLKNGFTAREAHRPRWTGLT